MINRIDPTELQLASLDAITVQSAGLRRLEDGAYASTLYTDSDDFGMLGGVMRVLAAQELYWQSPNSQFVFCNGRSAKQIAKFGPDVPTDAEIYEYEFRRGIELGGDRSTSVESVPKTMLENTSVNTIASVKNILDMCEVHGWKRIGLISSDYHIPRIEALCGLILQKLNNKVEISFMSAEALLMGLRPGVYDKEIQIAYQTDLALERIKNEQNGCNDISAGRYHIDEFQLAGKS